MKKHIIEIFSYPLIVVIYLVSILPLSLLYRISWILFFFLYYITGYRKKVVYDNLARSFPGKSKKELLEIRYKFYRHLSNVCVEVIKLLTISQNELKNRCSFSREAKKIINGYFSSNVPVIIVLGHYGNWEWSGSSFYSNFHKNLLTAYRPIKNRVFNRLMIKLRSSFGIIIKSRNELPRAMFSLRNKVYATALIADQTPSPSNAHWVKFLNQDTPVFKGTAKLSQMYNYPLIFCSTRLKKRGYYEIHARLVTSRPKDYDEYTLTSLHTKMLEEEIKNAPELWLWSHKRWKHKIPR